MSVHGLLLAAGAGRRMGTPKALVDDWLRRSVDVLTAGGCRGVTVVLGAGAEQAAALLEGSGARIVVADDWASGMGASLRTGLAALDDRDGLDGDAGGRSDTVGVTGALLHLVDLPDVPATVVSRVLAAVSTAGDTAALARAVYDGRLGHPVYLGREHWAGIVASATGDRGARAYLASRQVVSVECGDLASGEDRDTPVNP